MVCNPCRRGVHTGRDPWVFPQNKVEILKTGGMIITGAQVCKGGTWCDCQHRLLPDRVPR